LHFRVNVIFRNCSKIDPSIKIQSIKLLDIYNIVKFISATGKSYILDQASILKFNFCRDDSFF